MIRLSRKAYFILAVLFLILISLIAWTNTNRARANQDDSYDWRGDWAVPEGFSLSIDTEGYHFPTAIAFIPHPGTAPEDPLYFVTELRGEVKVVTHDRSVYTFARDFFQLHPEKELPEVEGETGLAGICLDPQHGYVFVTFAYQDAKGILRNNVIRFETTPQTFSLKPSHQLAFTDIFGDYEAAISHQIGSCQVSNGHLYVSVGDGRQTEQSQKVDSVLGKVLRMTLDGQPVVDNPYYQDGDSHKAENFVWAYGFRNPFGLKVLGERVFVADNGSDIDRFLDARKGENYLWNGNDWSIGARSNVALSPDVGPVQVDYSPAGSPLLPEQYHQSFFIAMSKPEMAGIMRIPYNLDEDQASGSPETFVKYQGRTRQIVVGLAFGPDGLYFVPTLPGSDGRSAVFRLAHDPTHQHPYLISQLSDPEALMWQKGCFGCHELNHEGGTAAPSLDQPGVIDRLEAKLNSEAYVQAVAAVDRLDREPFISNKENREEVLQAQGRERLRTWMIYHIMEPRFDNPNSQMPNLGVSRAEATNITDYLLREESFTNRVEERLLQYVPDPLLPRYLLFAFSGGFAMGALLLFLAFQVIRRMSRRELRRAEGGG